MSSIFHCGLWPALVLIIFLGSRCETTKLEVQKNAESAIAKQQLQQIYQQTKHMRYGKCWTEALEQLQAGCRQLTDEMQRRIAYAFARCHLQSAGRDIPPCERFRPVSDCTNSEALQDIAFSTYTEFFTHTQQICFHLQSQIWHEATEDTISQLADNSAEVASTLEESSLMARQMVERQNISLQNQQELLQNERLLRENMHKSVADAQKAHEETKAVIREQRALFAEVFDRVSTLQKTMLGEFTSIYTFGFYVGASILSYILTSTSRTSSARIWLFIFLTLNFIIEKIVVNRHLTPTFSEDLLVDTSALPETVYKDLWFCRKIFCVISLLSMVVCIIRYKDYGRINNHLLNEIKRQNLELQELLKEQRFNSFQSVNSFPTPLRDQVPVVGTSGENCPLVAFTTPSTDDVIEPFTVIETPFNEASLFKNVQHLWTRVSPYHSSSAQKAKEASLNTAQTDDLAMLTSYHSNEDSTFVATNDSFHSSETSSLSSYITGDSFPSTPLDSVSGMLHSIRSSTPSGRSRSRRSSISSTASFTEKLNQSVVEAEGVVIGGHNLRRRRRSGFQGNLKAEESIEAFIKSVAKVTVRRKRLLRQ